MLITAQDTANKLGIKRQLLDQWRCQGKGPKFIRMGRMIRYRPDDVDQWIADNEASPARDSSAKAA